MKYPTLILLCAVTIAWVAGCTREKITLTSHSPDGACRVEWVEYQGRLDRNFYLRLSRAGGGGPTTIFNSPDEGKPIGTERIVWSRDSSRFVLLGRHFFVGEHARRTNGEVLYLLYDLRSGNLRCNAKQQTQYPAFSADDLNGTEWNGDI